MVKIFRASLIYVALWSTVASAQIAARVAPPVLALTKDSAGALRPLTGIARAATVGSPLDFGFSLLQSAVAPDQDYLLATAAETPWPIRLPVDNGKAGIRTFEGVPNVSRIAISPAGSAAALLPMHTILPTPCARMIGKTARMT